MPNLRFVTKDFMRLPGKPRKTLATSQGTLYQLLDPKSSGIRLLQLHPARRLDSDIKCSLMHVSLDDKPQYSALSYVWGDANVKHCILINNLPVDITVNLYLALRRLRYATRPIVIWVDALCINQDDIQERNSQVALMGKIYSSAMTIHSWLGEKDGNSQRAFALVREWTKEADMSLDDRQRFWANDSTHLHAPYKPYYDDFCDRYAANRTQFRRLLQDDRFTDLHELFKRPYWKRVWIQQEIYLAHTIYFHCGEDQLSFNRLYHFNATRTMMWIGDPSMSSPDESVAAFVHIVAEPRIFMLNNARRDLLSLLEIIRPCDSTDARDKIYGMLGMYDGRVPIKVDYNASPAMVYVDFVQSLEQYTGKLFIDGSNGIGTPKDFTPLPDLPSWAPDFRERIPGGVMSALSFSNNAKPTQDRPSLVQWDHSHAVLQSIGYKVDRVAHVFPVHGSEDYLDVIWKFALHNLPIDRPDNSPFLPVLFRTILSLAEEDDKLSKQSFERFGYGFIGWLASSTIPHPDIDFIPLFQRQGMEEFCASGETVIDVMMGQYVNLEKVLVSHRLFLETAMGQSTWSQALFITEDNCIGRGPRHLQLGDEICILSGCTIPLAIRPSDEYHQVVGSCFIYGMMCGEAMEKIERGKFEGHTLRFK